MAAEKQNKIMSGVVVSDPAFTTLQSSITQLNILLEPEQLQFSLKTKENKVIYIQVFSFSRMETEEDRIKAISRLLTEEELLKKSYSNVHIGFSWPSGVLVPDRFYEDAKKESVLGFNTAYSLQDKVCADPVKSIGAYMVYAVPEELIGVLQRHYQTPILRHASSRLLEALISETAEETLYVYIQPHQFRLLCVKDKKLRFYNFFPYHSAEDYCYHLLNTAQQLGLDTEKVKVVLLGEINRSSDIFAMTYKYIRQVSFGRRHGGLTYSEAFDFAENFYFNLFIL